MNTPIIYSAPASSRNFIYSQLTLPLYPSHLIMHMSIITAAALACVPTVSAYFRVYLGGSNDPYGGGTGDLAQFFYEDPNCDTAESRTRHFNGNGNVLQDGWACEGCSAGQAPNDFNIAKFEVGHICLTEDIRCNVSNKAYTNFSSQMSATTDDFNAKRRVIQQQVGIVGEYYIP